MRNPDILDTIKDIKEITHRPALITIFNFNVDAELQNTNGNKITIHEWYHNQEYLIIHQNYNS